MQRIFSFIQQKLNALVFREEIKHPECPRGFVYLGQHCFDKMSADIEVPGCVGKLIREDWCTGGTIYDSQGEEVPQGVPGGLQSRPIFGRMSAIRKAEGVLLFLRAHTLKNPRIAEWENANIEDHVQAALKGIRRLEDPVKA